MFKPTRSKRNVVLAPRFVRIGAAQLESPRTEVLKIARISAFFVDHESITEGLYTDKDEATLLRQFWQAIRPSDRIFAADVEKTLSLIRRRSWDLNLIPSLEIDLCRSTALSCTIRRGCGVVAKSVASNISETMCQQTRPLNPKTWPFLVRRFLNEQLELLLNTFKSLVCIHWPVRLRLIERHSTLQRLLARIELRINDHY